MRILVAADGSPFSDEAVRSVAERPWPEGAEIRVLSVAPQLRPPPVGELMYSSLDVSELMESSRQHARTVAADAAERLRARGLKAEAHMREGDPRAEILDDATEWGADLIVVGSHGYTGLKKLVMGSVAEYVVDHAPCSVEVVRSRKPAAGGKPA
jgi:nucleotide-binding universal stress UspA family protein